MLQRRTIIAAAAAGLFFVAVAPLRAAENASPNDTARFLAGMPVAAESPLAPLTALVRPPRAPASGARAAPGC